MNTIWAETALLSTGWQKNVQIDVDQYGCISSVKPDTAPEGYRVGILLPASSNLHSHGFHRALAGLSEHRAGGSEDDFWTWRWVVYRFLDQLKPEDIQAITAFAQMEMLESGFAAVAEFHYVHHHPGGLQFQNIAENSCRITAASEESGIGLTLLPVFYQYGGCDKRELVREQKTFGNSPAEFEKLFQLAGDAVASLPSDCNLGVAAHSLRAVDPEGLNFAESLVPDSVIHIHVAEQPKEIEEFKSTFGVRPVDWLVDNMNIDEKWTIVHATHMTESETERLAKSKAVAGICPITEANLGDGTFNGGTYFRNKGRFGVGSDANILISLCEELRTLEYSQRLKTGARNVFANPNSSCGRHLYDNVTTGGAQSLNRNCGSIEVGKLADLLALDADHVLLADKSDDLILDSFVFCGTNSLVRDVWSAGRHVVSEGRHMNREMLSTRFLSTVRKLRENM